MVIDFCIEGSGGFRSLGGPIGSDTFKLEYIKETWEKTKRDWKAFKNMHSSSKWRMDVLIYCLRPRFNHLFRCIEPRVTLQIAAELDQWFFSQACSVAGHDWDPMDKQKKNQFMSSRRHGGSGMVPFEDLANVAYVASWMDCLFPKGVAQNGVRPDGSKSIAEMHPVFDCLGMKERVCRPLSSEPPVNLSRRRTLDKWAETIRLFSFDEVPADDSRFASLIQFRGSSEALFEIPEIRRACFENLVAFNAINGKFCRMHSQVGIPLPVRTQLEGEAGAELLRFDQLSSFADKLPRHDRAKKPRFRHNSLEATTAYEAASLRDGPEVGLLDARRAYKKLCSSSLVWLMGRHFVREENGEEKFQLAIAADFDTANIQGKEGAPLVAKVKIQKTLSLHLCDYVMNLRMQNNSTNPKDVLSGRTLDFPRYVQSYPLRRQKLVMTQLVARAGAVLHNIARIKPTHMNNVDFKFALDMRYNLVLGDYRRLREARRESDKMGSCPNPVTHAGRNQRGNNPSKGGRCLINCIRDAKIRLHNVVVAVLSKRIKGKGFAAEPREHLVHQTQRKRADIEVRADSEVNKPFYVDVTIVQQESDGKRAPRVKLQTSDNIVCCKDLEGEFVSRNHIFRKGTSKKLMAYAKARTQEISQGGESTPSVYPFAMDTSGSFCDTAILFLKKIAMVKFSNEPGSEPLLAWKRASWVQETCSLIQAAVLRTASRLFHRGLRECFEKDYERLFDVPRQSRTDNDVSGLSPIYIPAAG